MARIAGVDLPEQKRVDIGLTVIYGIGRVNVNQVLQEAKIEGAKRIKDLSEEEVNRLQKAVEKIKVEGDLRKDVEDHIKRMEEINSYRGLRHRRGLPVRGQRTRSNARTRRGRRKTIGAIRKDVAAKMQPAQSK